MELTAKQLALILRGTVDGDENAKVTKFAKIEHGKPGALCFFANPKYEQYVYTSGASVLLVNKDFEPSRPVPCTMVRVENAYKAVADLLKYVSKMKRRGGRHRSLRARWFLTTRFGKRVYVGAFSYVGHHTVVGDDTIIYEHVYIGDDCKIGKNCIFYPGVRIYPGMEIGNNVILHANAVIGADGFGNVPLPDGSWEKIEHLGKVIIEDNVEIGACTTVDRAEMEATIIHKGVKIDNLCQIAHNVEIGENTAMAAMVGIAGSAKIGKNCLIAGQVGIAGHLTVPDRTTLAAKTGVIGSLKGGPGQTFLGTPALPSRLYMRCYALFKKAGEER